MTQKTAAKARVALIIFWESALSPRWRAAIESTIVNELVRSTSVLKPPMGTLSSAEPLAKFHVYSERYTA